MDWIVILSSTVTVVSFVLFVGIVWWAASERRRGPFAVAANAPFALPDETAPIEQTAPSRARQSS